MEVDFWSLILIIALALAALYVALPSKPKRPVALSKDKGDPPQLITVADLVEALLIKVRTNPQMEVRDLLAELTAIVEGVNALCTDEECKVAKLNLADPGSYLDSIKSVLEENPDLDNKLRALLTTLSSLSDKTKTATR